MDGVRLGGSVEGQGISVNGVDEKKFCPNFLQPRLENVDRTSCNDGSRELIPIFQKPHLKGRYSPSAVARTLSTLKECPLWPRRVGGRKMS